MISGVLVITLIFQAYGLASNHWHRVITIEGNSMSPEDIQTISLKTNVAMNAVAAWSRIA